MASAEGVDRLRVGQAEPLGDLVGTHELIWGYPGGHGPTLRERSGGLRESTRFARVTTNVVTRRSSRWKISKT